VYAYTDKSMWYYFWRPVFRLMSHDIRFLHETGIRNYLAQSSAVRWEYSGPLYWATARLLWDPSRDIEGLISEWCEAMYGPASETMLTHYNTLEQAVLATGQHYRDHPATQAGGLYDMGWIAEAEKLLSDAEAAAGEGSVHAERIAAVRGRWLLSQACYDSVDQYRRYEESGDLADLEKVIQAAEMLAKRAGGGAWTPYSCRTVDELREELASGGITWKSFGQEETKGGRTCRNADETGRGDGAAGWATIHFLAPEGGATLAMAVWGESAGFTPVICSGGRGAGTAAGGVWSPIGTFTPTGKPEWQEVEFEIPETLYEPGVKRQMVGFGGADSQIWVAEVGVEAR
ncbi:MAG: DUF4838 domain-containing protein, partial [Candidatus Brocadiia bacterium]|nr:DUF4838 domain-containing protein [Candidatus Brocadiia bacterium]